MACECSTAISRAPSGTLSAVTDALESLSIPEVNLQVVDKGVGPVSCDSDTKIQHHLLSGEWLWREAACSMADVHHAPVFTSV
jgi:hypothetical protein